MSAAEDELRSLAEKASPGPWHWSGYKSRSMGHGPYIATWIPGQGRTTVMDFCRLGMGSGQPRFNTDLRMVEAVELAVREVPYRDDVIDVDHPDARFMVAANPRVILGLLDELRSLRAACADSTDKP